MPAADRPVRARPAKLAADEAVETAKKVSKRSAATPASKLLGAKKQKNEKSPQKSKARGPAPSRIEVIEERLQWGLNKICEDLEIPMPTSRTYQLALKLLRVSVKDLLKWEDPEPESHPEWQRWAAACVFIVQRSKDASDVRSIRSLLGLIAPETLLGFLERCDCVCNLTDPLVWADREVILAAVKTLGQFRRSLGLLATLNKAFQRFFDNFCGVAMTPKETRALPPLSLAENMSWTMWCYLRRRLWFSFSRPEALMETQLALLLALARSRFPKGAFALRNARIGPKPVVEDRMTPPTQPPTLQPLSGSSASSTTDVAVNTAIPDQPSASSGGSNAPFEPLLIDFSANNKDVSKSGTVATRPDTSTGDSSDALLLNEIYGSSLAGSGLNADAILKLSESMLSHVPERLQGLFAEPILFSVDICPLRAFQCALNPAYLTEVNRDLLGYDERAPQSYRLEAQEKFGRYIKDSSAAWVCQQVNKYDAQLFKRSTRQMMNSCFPNPTSDIEKRVEMMVRRFGSHCAPGVSDHRGTTAIYSAFFDAIIENERKTGPQPVDGLLRSDEFQRSLFAVAAHVMGYFADIPKYPALLEVCDCPALDFFKAGYLVVEALPALLPEVLRQRVQDAMTDVIHRRGWRRSERFPVPSSKTISSSLPFASEGIFASLPVSASPSSSSSSTNEHKIITNQSLGCDGMFLWKVREETHRMFLKIAGNSGFPLSGSGKVAMRKGMRLLDAVLKDEAIVTDRNMRAVAVCVLYCSARAYRLQGISFESILQGVFDTIGWSKLKEAQMDLSLVELGGNKPGTVIDYYNQVFLPVARKWLHVLDMNPRVAEGGLHVEQGGLTLNGVDDKEDQDYPDLSVLTPFERKMVTPSYPDKDSFPNVTVGIVPQKVTGFSFRVESRVVIGVGFNRKFFAYD